MSDPLSNPQIRKLKALSQHLEPMAKVGKAGLTEAFIRDVGTLLDLHELVKVKFVGFKEEKATLSAELATRTSSRLIMRIGHVAVLYRSQADPAKRKIVL